MSLNAKPEISTFDLLALDQAYVWHPFTNMQQWAEGAQVMIDRAERFELIDTDGNRYLDAFSSLWCNVHGHRVPEIDRAVIDQLGKVAHTTLLGLANKPAAQLAAKLIEIAPKSGGPPLSKVFYSDSGATATEIAFKLAAQYFYNLKRPSKREFVSFTGAYHGDTTGAMSVGRMPQFNRAFEPLLFHTHVVAPCLSQGSCDARQSGDGKRSCDSLLVVENIFKDRAAHIAAPCVEPMVQGAGGMLVQPPCFLRGLRTLCDQYDVLLIADEVATGFARTGKMFACEHARITPDLLCIGKGLTGGYMPLAATLATQKIFDAFLGEPHEGKTFFHGHTFTGNPLACAAALASIDLMQQRDTVAHVNSIAKTIAPRLEKIRSMSGVSAVRQLGVMIGIDLGPFDAIDRVAFHTCRRMWKKGVMIRNLGDTIILMPPPMMPVELVLRVIDVIEEEIGAIGKTQSHQSPALGNATQIGDAW